MMSDEEARKWAVEMAYNFVDAKLLPANLDAIEAYSKCLERYILLGEYPPKVAPEGTDA